MATYTVWTIHDSQQVLVTDGDYIPPRMVVYADARKNAECAVEFSTTRGAAIFAVMRAAKLRYSIVDMVKA